MDTLYDRLKAYSESDYYGFHMPGHKRNKKYVNAGLPCEWDITEIEGFDDLHHAEGILKEAQEQAAQVYRADETHFLVNGSTVGLLSAVLGVTEREDTILVARNCHKSVYHAIDMNELRPVYLYPEFDSQAGLNMAVSAEDVELALREHPRIRAVVMVSPTYDGVVSDVKAISEVVHKKEIPLIVDEAHGAHFGFHPYFPKNSNLQGADIVIHSLHKTSPSLTRTALHRMNGTFVNREAVREYLHMLQSSSPSYLLMASIDSCVNLLKQEGANLFDPYVVRLEKLRKSLKKLQSLQLVETEDYDRSKIVISAGGSGVSGKELQNLLLSDYHLQMEMAAGNYVLAMTSVGDTEEGFARLEKALFELDESLEKKVSEEMNIKPPKAELVYTTAQMKRMKKMQKGEAVSVLPWKESIGFISMEYAYLYPPGTPMIVQGERITKEITDALRQYERLGFSIEGLHTEGCIEVWNNG